MKGVGRLIKGTAFEYSSYAYSLSGERKRREPTKKSIRFRGAQP